MDYSGFQASCHNINCACGMGMEVSQVYIPNQAEILTSAEPPVSASME
jgi:hypothetical protein